MSEQLPTPKRFCYINRKAPHGTGYALESLESALVAGAFEQDVTLVFLDDGVFQLVKDQTTDEIGLKNFSPTYKALSHYDIEKIYVEECSLTSRGLLPSDLIIDVEVLSSEQITDLLERQQIIITA